ncbi:MAG: hypothetical protein ABW321_23225 [Polyangiales bacterium]
MNRELTEHRESLWWLVAPPLIWAGHLLASYCTAAIYCQKYAQREDPLGQVRWAIAIYSALALLAIAALGVRGYRRHQYGDSTGSHSFDTAADRHRFLGFASFLLACISAVAVVYQSLPAVFIGSCR